MEDKIMTEQEKLAMLEDVLDAEEGTLSPEQLLEDVEEYDSMTKLSIVVMMEDEFNRKLVKPSEAGTIYIDLDEKYLLKGDMNTTSSFLSKLTASGIMTINEARQHLGLSPVKGGDEIIMPYTKIEDNKINNNQNNDGE